MPLKVSSIQSYPNIIAILERSYNRPILSIAPNYIVYKALCPYPYFYSLVIYLVSPLDTILLPYLLSF